MRKRIGTYLNESTSFYTHMAIALVIGVVGLFAQIGLEVDAIRTDVEPVLAGHPMTAVVIGAAIVLMFIVMGTLVRGLRTND